MLMLWALFLLQQALDENLDLLEGITGFEDSVRKFICHVVGITYQHIDRWLLAEMLGDLTGEACCCLCQPEKVQVVGVGPQPAQGNPVHHFEVIIWSREG